MTVVGAAASLLFIFPVFIMIMTALKPEVEIFNMELLPRVFTTENLRIIFTEKNFEQNILNSLFVAVLATFLSLILQSTSAYALSRLRFRGRDQVFLLVISTMMIPFSVIMIPLFIITNSMHMGNTLWGVVIPVAANGYGVYLLRQFFFGIPRDLDESAFIDGASHFRIFYSILLPLCKPIITTLGTSYFIYNWNNYLWPMIVINDKSKWVIQVAIASFKSERMVRWNMVFAGAVIASIPMFLLFAFFQRYIVAGIKTSGMKT